MSMNSLIKSIQKKLHERTKDIPQLPIKSNVVIATCNQVRCKMCHQIRNRTDMKIWFPNGDKMKKGCNICYLAYLKRQQDQDPLDYIGCGYN